MNLWDRAEQALVGVLGLAALAFALWQVLSRYFFPQASISYAEEVIVYLLIWAIMIISDQLVRTDSHVRPDVVRNFLPDMFQTFDFPEPSETKGVRDVTTVPTQALFMMNSKFAIEQSKFAAQKLGVLALIVEISKMSAGKKIPNRVSRNGRRGAPRAS